MTCWPFLAEIDDSLVCACLPCGGDYRGGAGCRELFQQPASSPVITDSYSHRRKCLGAGQPGSSFAHLEDSPAPGFIIVPVVQPDEQFSRADAQQCGADHVGELVRVVTHAAEAIEQGERVKRRRYTPFIVIVLAHPSR
jgi:hypothetical protein